MSIDYRGPLCGCGKRGCIEVLAAGPAIGRRAQCKLAEKNQRESLLWNLAGMSPDAITSEMVGRAAATGDALAQEVLLETVALLGLWLSNVVDLLEPDVIIMGGGVASMLKPFFGTMHAQISNNCVNSRGHEIPLVAACYGADSGVAGGAALCAQRPTAGTRAFFQSMKPPLLA
jgi:glucokinase